MKIICTISIFLIITSNYSQNLNFRKAILKSDLILTTNDFTFDTIKNNDFSETSFVTINTSEYVLRNNLASIPKKITARRFLDNEDFFSDLVANGGGCVMNTREGINQGESYYDLFFLKKIRNEYHAFLIMRSVESDKSLKITKQIRTISKFEKIKDDKERFEKTLDWFIENGLKPDLDFVDYYKKKNITTDTIVYSEQQTKNALEQFLKGNEELLPIVRIKYFEDVKNYYIKILQLLIDKNELDWKDYYQFREAISGLTNELNNDSESGNYLLYNQLTNDKFDKYEKSQIMSHLLQVAKDWTLE